MGVKIKVTRAGKKADASETPDVTSTPRTPMSYSIDSSGKVLRSMTKQLENALMKELTPVHTTVFDGSLPQPKFGVSKRRKGFSTTSKQNQEISLGGKVDFRKNSNR